MQQGSLKYRKIETTLFILVWVLVFSVPFFSKRDLDHINWNMLAVQWIRLGSYLIIFLLNVYLLVPVFLFTKKYGYYLLCVIISILLLFFAQSLLRSTLAGPGNSATGLSERVSPGFPPGMPPPGSADGSPPGFPPGRPHDAYGMPPPPDGPGGFEPGMPPPMQGDSFERGLPPAGSSGSGTTVQSPSQKPPLLEFIDNLLIGLLVAGAGTASKLVSKWLDEEKQRTDIEKEQLKTNLALLRHQVSPHFFMNTLNNIHALIDIDTEDAKDAIIRLSTLMRYLLYDSAQPQIHLKKEIDFIKSFISLMQIRYSDKVLITLIVPEQIPDIQIPPMLFISILENAFKHGISYQSPSFIYFEITVFEQSLKCKVKNRKHQAVSQPYDEYAGIGLQNIRKSLQLLYNNQYQLDVLDKENEFEVNLIIPL
jgi:hypothetical protein